MTWLASIIVGLLTALLGGVCASDLGELCVKWYRISGREGGSSVFVVMLSILGFAVGFVVGVLSARIVASGTAPSFLKSALIGGGSILGLVAVTAFICWMAADLPTKIGDEQAFLYVEIACPPGFTVRPDALPAHWDAHLDTEARGVTSRSPLQLEHVRQEKGQCIIPVVLEINTSARDKELHVWLGEQVGDQRFYPKFSKTPGVAQQSWSPWQQSTNDTPPLQVAAAPGFQIRFRVDRAPPLPPLAAPVGPTPTELAAEASRREADAFAALTANSSLLELLEFARYSQPEERRNRAGALIGQRPDVVAEMSTQILSSDPETSLLGLRALAFIKPLPAALATPVAERGAAILSALRELIASPRANDPRQEREADIGALFNAWSEGPYALQKYAGVDCRPQLTEIIALASARPDSPALNSLVVQARFIVDQWRPAPALP